MDIKVNNSSILVFDLDDTLYNEIEFLKSAYKCIAKELDPKSWKFLYSQIFSLYRNKENVFASLSEKYDRPIAELVQMYRLHEPQIDAFDDVINTFKQIKTRGGKIGIITDGRSITQRNKIKALKLESYIDKIIISEEIGTEKPHPNNFQVMEDHFRSKQFFYFADNFKKDFISPNKMGWTTVGLLDNGLNIHSNSHLYNKKENLPNALIYSYSEINFT